MHFDLLKNSMAALNNERLAKIWNPGNAKLQTHNCKLQFAVSHENPDAKGLYYIQTRRNDLLPHYNLTLGKR